MTRRPRVDGLGKDTEFSGREKGLVHGMTERIDYTNTGVDLITPPGLGRSPLPLCLLVHKDFGIEERGSRYSWYFLTCSDI